MTSSDNLVKVLVEIPNHWAKSGESIWAKPLASDLYEIHNTPFYAYGLNYLDVVHAKSDDPKKKPVVTRLERRSGRRTLRVLFEDFVERSQRLLILKRLDQHGVTWEGSEYRLFALDIPPDGNYQAVCDLLWAWEQDGLLQYETCEERVEGSFDDKPSKPA